MAFDPHKDFPASTVATAPSPATSGTSLVLAAGGGALMPTPGAVGFRGVAWPAGLQPTRANAEIVRVTALSTDTLTITRAIDGSTARTILAGDNFAANICAGTLTDIEGLLTQGLTSADSPTFAGVTLSGLSQYYLVLGGAGGQLVQDTNLYWISSTLAAVSTTDFTPAFNFSHIGSTAASGPYFNFQRARAGNTDVVNGDTLGTLQWWGYKNTALRGCIAVTAYVNGVPSGSVVPSALDIYLTNAALNDTTVMRLTTTGVGIGVLASARLHLPAGTATASTAPLKIDSGTNLTTPEVGVVEYDGVQFYDTIDTSSGRGAVDVAQYVHLASDGGTISTIANFFGTSSNISLVASAYYLIEIVCYFLNSTSGTVTWTLTNSAAPTAQNIYVETSPIGGVVAPPGTATALVGQFSKDATAAKAWTSGTLTTAVDHYARIRIELKNGTGTSLKIQATKNVGGTITPRLGSYWICRRISPNNVGTFAS